MEGLGFGLAILGFIAIFIFFSIFVYFIPIGLWISAVAAKVHISLLSLVGMRLRRVPPPLILKGLISATKAGIQVSSDQLEAHFLAGGNVLKVINALIAADKANIDLTFGRAAAIDLAGRDVLGAVQTSVNPRVIDAPATGTVAAVAKDGIQLQAKARVTVRTNIERLVGGATEETIIARVGEGIVTAIGSSQNYKEVLENPDKISKTVLAKGLDSGTAFEILSIDIADVDVGRNIGAQLQADQAEADLKVARAKAETRRAMAVAVEQEMKARVQEMQAKVVESEAEVPKAMAEAFRQGNLGIMDYYTMRNVQADTKMRNAIGGADKEPKKE